MERYAKKGGNPKFSCPMFGYWKIKWTMGGVEIDKKNTRKEKIKENKKKT